MLFRLIWLLYNNFDTRLDMITFSVMRILCWSMKLDVKMLINSNGAGLNNLVSNNAFQYLFWMM